METDVTIVNSFRELLFSPNGCKDQNVFACAFSIIFKTGLLLLLSLIRFYTLIAYGGITTRTNSFVMFLNFFHSQCSGY